MLAVNERQSEFYETKDEGRGNALTRMWRRARLAQKEVRIGLGIDGAVYEKHWEWMGDVSDKRILDLGCYEGNKLSLPLAKKSGSYLGLDLSRPAIAILNEKIRAAGCPNARAVAADFLSPDFSEDGFDVIYAHSVAHHFKYFDVFLAALQGKLSSRGMVVTIDPMETSWPVKLARVAYRPFQADSAWEWPFNKKSFEMIQRRFDVVGVQGMMGRAKWSLPIALLDKGRALSLGTRWHERDLREATTLGPALWRCMQVSMCWKPKRR